MQNIYEAQNPSNFKALKALVEQKPRGFKQMLEAKGNKKCPNAVPKHAYLLKWMDEVLPQDAQLLCTKEKCWWILHGLTAFPECKTCKNALDSSSFTNIVHGYREYCCLSCAHKSEEHSKHLSESYARNVEKDADFFKKCALKNKETRCKHNNGKYFSEESLEKRKHTIASDPSFYERRNARCKETKVKNGHSPTWNNSEKNVETRRRNNNGAWETEESLRHRREHAQAKYGVDDASKFEEVKRRKAEAFQAKYGVGVICWFQTQASKDYMKAINEQRKAKELATKKKNGTFKSSKPEERAYDMLHFMCPHLLRQYKSAEYPFACDFYDPQSNTYFECNFSWTHGGHWFDRNDPTDMQRLEHMKSKHTAYYDNAIETWTVRDVKKRQCAEKNHLNYIVFWTEDEVRQYVLDQLDRIAQKSKQ